MRKSDALTYVSYAVDDALSPRNPSEAPEDARLIGWQCGFEPLFVAVWSYLGVTVDADDAVDIATDYLNEIGWFTDGPTDPDYVI